MQPSDGPSWRHALARKFCGIGFLAPHCFPQSFCSFETLRSGLLFCRSPLWGAVCLKTIHKYSSFANVIVWLTNVMVWLTNVIVWITNMMVGLTNVIVWLTNVFSWFTNVYAIYKYKICICVCIHHKITFVNHQLCMWLVKLHLSSLFPLPSFWDKSNAFWHKFYKCIFLSQAYL